MLNANAIRVKVQQAINKMPSSVALQRFTKTSDGMGGYTVSDTPDTVATFNGLLDNSKHSALIPTLVEAGTIIAQRSYKLYAVYDSAFDIQVDDFFTVKGITYTVKNAVNILNLDIYWECDLEVNNNGH
mgnify:FL=1